MQVIILSFPVFNPPRAASYSAASCSVQLQPPSHARPTQMPRSRVKMDLKMATLLAKQQALRADVEREHLELSGLSDKMYRKAQRETGKVKFDIIRVRLRALETVLMVELLYICIRAKYITQSIQLCASCTCCAQHHAAPVHCCASPPASASSTAP